MPLRVAALELPARWAQPARALADADALLSTAATDLALLPEASLTGYVSPAGDFDLRPFVEPLDGPHAAALAALAKKHRTFLAGPLIEHDHGRFYNAMVVFDRDGARVARYRKRHPWVPETWATPGDGPYASFDVDGARVACAVCYDAQFLVDERPAEIAGADVLLFASAWVEREDSRPELLGAIARTFDVAIVNANWGEGSPRVPGQGGSMIVRTDGRVVVRAERGAGPRLIDAVV